MTHVADARQDGLRWEGTCGGVRSHIYWWALIQCRLLPTGNVEIARRVCKALSTAGADPVDEDEACELLCAMQVWKKTGYECRW